MKTFDIGPGVTCDPEVLLNTRLLIQANSGSGKSWALRRLLEQTSGQVQQIVIDPEGEFVTLRERFDYVLAAKSGGDTLADPRTAKLLAERLLELGVSAVLDIYELKSHERVRFVRLFLEALVDAPKRLWHPALIVLDEAHVFAPEKGSAESLQAVIDLSTRGRKRGFCLVQATQRLSKLHKDAAAEANNKLIGRSALDVDMERAGDELGMTKAGRQILRDLDAGEFFAFGPALTRTVTRVKVGPVTTSHPKAGSKLAGVVPPPTERVKAVLSKLADLPAEAEQRERTMADLKARIAELERAARTAKPASEYSENIPAKTVEVLTDADRALLKSLADVGDALRRQWGNAAQSLAHHFHPILNELIENVAAEGLKAAERDAARLAKALNGAGLKRIVEKLARVSAPVSMPAPTPARQAFSSMPPAPVMHPAPRMLGSDGKTGSAAAAGVTPVQQRILNALAELEQLGARQPARELVAFMAGYTHLQSKGFVNAMSGLSTAGCIAYGAGTVALTEAGRAVAQAPKAPRTARDVQDRVIAMLGGASGRILEPLIEAYPKAMPRQAVAERAGYGHLQSKGFVNAISRLRTLGFVDYPDRGSIVAKPVLFLEA